MDRVVVVCCDPKPLPGLRIAPVALKASPEVADTSCRVTKWIFQAGCIKGSINPLEVIRRIIAYEDGAFFAECFQPMGKVRHHLVEWCNELPCHHTHRRIVLSGVALPDHAMIRLPCFVVHSP